MSYKIVAILTAFAMSGCVTAEQNQTRVAALDDTACHSYGAASGTDAYFQCRMIKDHEHQEADQLAMQRWHESFQHNVDQLSAAFAPPPTIIVHNIY